MNTQRTIKFRAWDGEKKRFISIELNNFDGKAGIEIKPYSLQEIPNEVIYQQFTNLKDKNGKEIYEGDIVEITENKDFNGNWVIVLEKMPLHFRMDKIGYGCFIGLKDYFNGQVWEGPSISSGNNNGWNKHIPEVIGNIYENKELLK